MSKTNYLQAVISYLQRMAGPYRGATTCREQTQQSECVEGDLLDHLVGAREDVGLERMLPRTQRGARWFFTRPDGRQNAAN
jgi:hypothetical protein